MNELKVNQSITKKNKMPPCRIIALMGILSLLNPQFVAAQSEAAETEVLEEVRVTGSRLVRRDLEAVSPIVGLSADQILSFGPVTLDSVVKELPQLAPTDGRQAGFENRDAVLKADLRGLGPARTLVLVNGRRYTPASADGLVDLGTIPTSMLERVDILTGGASAVYGSDAIAGAINFVLKDRFEGLQARAVYGETFEGDGENINVDLLTGANFSENKGNIMVAASYLQGKGVFQGDRDFSRAPFLNNGDGTLTQVGSSSIPGGLIPGLHAGLPVPACPVGSSAVGTRFLEGGEATSYCNPADAYNYAPGIHLLRPFEQWQLSTVFNYEVTDRVEVYGEFFYANAQTDWQVGPDGKIIRDMPVNAYSDNPILTEATRNFLIANAGVFDPDNTGNALLPQFRKRFSDVGSRTYEVDRDSQSFTAGLRGDLDFAGSEDWAWDAFVTYQESTSNKLNSGVTLNSRIAAGLNTVIVNGQAQCADLSSFAECTPLNLFGENTLTAEQGAWLAPSFIDQTDYSRIIANASVTGNLFELPAGPVVTAFGLEYREDEFHSIPAPENASGDSGISAGPPVSGSYDVTEAFFEAGIPVFEDLLSFELGARFANYSMNGIGSNTSWKAGLMVTPTEWLNFRGAYNRAVRAPNLMELYSAVSNRFLSAVDPCDSRSSPSAQIKALCVEQGIASSEIDTFIQFEQGAFVTSGGNLDLQEETADSYTLGTVISPVGSSFNLQIDYYDIRVKDAIGTAGQQTIIDNCFASLDANDNFCRLIERDNIGQIFTVSANLNNISERKVTGLDVTMDYVLDSPWLDVMSESSQLQFSLLSSFQFKNESTAYRGAETIDCAGYFLGPCSGFANPSTPDQRFIGNVDWQNGPLNVGLRARWIGSLELYESSTFPLKKLDAVTYIDLNVGYELSERVRMDFGAINLFDKQPVPVSAFELNDSNVDPAVYDQIGARFYIGITARL